MVDTLYLYYQLTEWEYNDTFTKLQLYFTGSSSQLRKDKVDKNAYVTNGLSKFGFQEIRLRYNKKYGYRAIEIRLRPKLLISEQNYYDVTSITEFKDVSHEFDHIIKEIIGINVHGFFHWKAKRIDYAVDLKVENDLIPKYMFLFKKGNIPNYMLKNQNTKKYFNSKTNLYLVSKNVTVNFYDRYKTLIKKQEIAGNIFTNIEDTKGLLRLEVQCRKCDKELLDLLSVRVCKKKILLFHNLIVGKANYYTMSKCREIINKINCQRKRMALIRLIELVHREGSIWGAKKQYLLTQKNSAKALDAFSKRLNQLRKLGLNAVALPEEWGVSQIDNLYSNIQKHFRECK